MAERSSVPTSHGKSGRHSRLPGFLVFAASLLAIAVFAAWYLTVEVEKIIVIAPNDVAIELQRHLILVWTVVGTALAAALGFLVVLYLHDVSREKELSEKDEEIRRHARDIAKMFAQDKLPSRIMLRQLRDAINELPMIIWVIDPDGKFLLSEGGSLAKIGLQPGRAMGRTMYDMYGGAPEIIDINTRALNGETLVLPLRFQNFHYMVRVSPFRDEDGNMQGALGVALDVTELEHARERLQLTEKQFEALVRLSPIGILLFTSGKIEFANRRAAEILGASSEELLVGKTAADFVRDADKELLTEQMAILRKGGAVAPREARVQALNGKTIDVSISAVPLDTEKESSSLVVLEDISDRKRAENVNLRLASIVESADDAIIGKDLDGTITAWNAGAERLYGYTAKEAIGQPIHILAPNDDELKEIDDILERVSRGERIEPFTTQRRTKNGRVIDVRVTVSPVRDADGRIAGASAIAYAAKGSRGE